VLVADYLRDVLVPANVAVAAIQRAGLPIDVAQLRRTREAWQRELAEMEAYVEGEAAKVGVTLKYSERHGVHPPKMAAFLFGGLGLAAGKPTAKGGQSTDAESLLEYASINVPWTAERPGPDGQVDHPVVSAVLKIRSVAKGIGTYLDSFERTVRADGACHPKINWALRTSRLSAEDPPVHQIPERSDPQVADGVKSCIVPRVKPCLAPGREGWDPRKHGSCGRWDINGAEAAWRAAALADHYGVRDPIAYDYIRLGKDIHSKTASIIYEVPEGTYQKGSFERDSVGKPSFFGQLFGGSWKALKWQMWKEGRIHLSDDEVKRIVANFAKGYSGITALYEVDKTMLGERMDTSATDGKGNVLSWCEDPYGRIRAVEIPKELAGRFQNGVWRGGYETDYELSKRLNHAFHIAANTPTQSANASDTLWMLALLYAGEYVELRVPPLWERGGVPYPEAAGWAMHGGPGPGGKPFQAWHCNTVHDSGWFDCAPGYLEPTAKLITRRCTALPQDWRLEADVPYRIELKVGPDMSDLRPYNKVAREFGLEEIPDR
jgi:hypothetical protein